MLRAKHLLFALCFLAFATLSLHATCSPTLDGMYYGCVVADSNGVTLLQAGGLALTGQSGWIYYNGNDAPQGAWRRNSGAVTAQFTLPSALSIGTYYIFNYGGDYDSHRSIYYTACGATSDTVNTDDRDGNGLWSTRNTIVLVSSCDTFVAHIGDGTLFIFQGVKITPNASMTVDKAGQSINLTVPTVIDSAHVDGNKILDPSFETGFDGQFMFSTSQARPLSSYYDCTGAAAHSGTCGVKIPLVSSTQTYLCSKVFNLVPNRVHSASVWMKVSSGTVAGGIDAFNTYIPPVGYPAQWHAVTDPNLSASGASTLTTTWQRFYVTAPFRSYPSPYFQICIILNNGSTDVYMDDIQLEEGPLTTFTAKTFPINFSLAFSQPGNVYYSDDTLTATLKLNNPDSMSRTQTVKYEIWSYKNERVVNSTTTVTLGANATTSQSFSLATGGLLGSFRVKMWIAGKNNSEKEFTYAIVPHGTDSVDTTSNLGIHCTYLTDFVDVYKKLGFKWCRDLSPGALVRWELVEPTDDNFTFTRDSELANACAGNMETLGVLYAATTPSFALSNGSPSPVKYADYAYQTVTHFKSLPCHIKYWEMWNEEPWSASVYAELMKAGVDAILAADATAKPVCMSGVPATTMTAVLTYLASTYPTWDPKVKCYALSGHGYPEGQPPSQWTPFVTDGYKVWNTESGYSSFGTKSGAFVNWPKWGIPLLPFMDATKLYVEFTHSPVLVATTYLESIAAGLSNYFYYDGRWQPDYQSILAGYGSEFSTHWTIFDYDFTARTKAVALSVAKSFVDHTTGGGNVSMDASSRFLMFDTGNTSPVAVLYSTDRAPRQVTLSGITCSNVTVKDFMGNSIACSSGVVQYGRFPVYVKGVSISFNTLSTALSSGTVATRSDTEAPAPFIVDGPIEELPADFTYRFFARDDTGYPNNGEVNNIEATSAENRPDPEAIVYSTNLSPYDGDWTAYSQDVIRSFTGVPAGNYTFSVRAKDRAGNVGTITRTLGVVVSPTLSSVSPASGDNGTVVPVTLTGTNFDGGGAAVNITGSGITVSAVTVVNATTITATFTVSASAALGARTVNVSTNAGTTGNQTFTVTTQASTPTLSSITPTVGKQGTTIYVNAVGTNFVSPATMTVSGTGVTVTSTTVLSSTSIQAVVAITRTATKSTRLVTISTSAGTTGAKSFTVQKMPPGQSSGTVSIKTDTGRVSK